MGTHCWDGARSIPTRSPVPACPWHGGLGLPRPATPSTHILSIPHALRLAGCFPWGCASLAQAGFTPRQPCPRQGRQKHRAGQCQACVGLCRVLCSGGAQTMYRTPWMCTGMWPHRGARQLLDHSQQHDTSLGRDVDESAVRAVSAAPGAGCGRGAGLTGAPARPRAEPARAPWWGRGGCSPGIPGERRWAARSPRRRCRPAPAAGGSQAAPGPPWRAAPAGRWPGSSGHGSAAPPALGEKQDTHLSPAPPPAPKSLGPM